MIWPELSSMIAPESLLSSTSSGFFLPVAGWGNPGSDTPGLMGMSPVSDPAGWLTSDFSGVRFESWNALTYRAGRSGKSDDNLSAGYSVIHASVPLIDERLFLLAGGTGSSSSADFEFGMEKGYLRRHPTESHSWLGVKGIKGNREYLISVGEKGHFHGDREAAAAMKMDLRSGMSLAIWASGVVSDDRFEIEYGSDNADVTAPSSRYMYGSEWRGTVMGWLLGFRLQRRWGRERGDEEPMHRLKPEPDMWLLDLRAGSPDGKILLSGGLGMGEHRAQLSSYGLRYARFLLNDHRFWLRTALNLNLSGVSIQLWSGFTGTSLRGEGDLEFWPFTPAIIDLLGLRRRAVADLGVNVVSAGGRKWLKRTDLHHIYLGVDLHHLWTAGEFESWEPLVLGLGRINVLLDQLRLQSAQLLDLGLQGKISITDGTVVQCGLAQMLPLALQERRMPDGEPASGTDRGEKDDIWGGFRWWISFSFDMHH